MPSESENFACCDGVESINLIFTFAHSTTHTHTHIDFNRSVSESVSFLYFPFSLLLSPSSQPTFSGGTFPVVVCFGARKHDIFTFSLQN